MAFDFDELELTEQSLGWKLRNPALECVPDCRQKRMSRARVWFEIKRCFEADARRGCVDWKTCYARELLLKAIKEALQRDGFVMIEAFLPVSSARRLSKSMMQTRPVLCSADQRSTEGSAEDDSQAPQGWVGSHLSRGSAAAGDICLPDLTLSSSFGENWEITFEVDSYKAIRSCNKDELVRMTKTFVHTIADNSMSEAQLSETDRTWVQLSFGDQLALQEAKARRTFVSPGAMSEQKSTWGIFSQGYEGLVRGNPATRRRYLAGIRTTLKRPAVQSLHVAVSTQAHVS